MSYNGSGTFVINTAGQPVVSGTVISSTAFNALTADLATGLSTAITKDGQTTPTANIPMGNNKITNLAVGTAATDAANLSQVQSTTAKLVNSISGADTITGTMSPNLAAYATGQMFYFIAAGDNTGAVTLNIDALGAKSVTRDGSVALAAGDIKSGEVVVVVYDGTRFQVVSQINSSGNATFANVSITSALNVGGVATVTGGATLNGGVVINELGADADTRIEGDTDANLFFADASTDRIGIGTSSPSNRLTVSGANTAARGQLSVVGASASPRITLYEDSTFYAAFAASGTDGYIGTESNTPFRFITNGTERARFTAGGEFLVGTTSNVATAAASEVVFKTSTSSEGFGHLVMGNATYNYFVILTSDNAGYNAASATQLVGKIVATGRSINAAGTVNASGADYAEYMTKDGEFTIAKGDVCGIDANGKLTNVFANAISFVVKSSDPAYVGNDKWGIGITDPVELEEARKKVDRIAFAGQLAVNVLGATPGQYIVPVDDNGAIKGVAVSNPTFEQYQSAVGKVISVQDDGRAWIIVKVA